MVYFVFISKNLRYDLPDSLCRQTRKTDSHCLSPLLTGPLNPISVASDSYLYELELTSQRSSLGDDWTNVPVIPGQFSVAELQRRSPRLISDDRNTE